MSVEQPQDTASVSHQQIAMASGSRHPTDPVYLAHEAEPQILLILVGLPGSGKTTLALALERCSDTSTSDTNVELAGTSRPAPPPRRWVRASQDDAPSRRRQEAERVTREALMSGDNVVVDRCDFDPQQRAHFINIALSLNNPPPPPTPPPPSDNPAPPFPLPPPSRRILIYALILQIPLPTLRTRLSTRTSHPTLPDPQKATEVLEHMTRQWIPPHPARSEGFDRVLVLNEHDQPAGVPGVPGAGARSLSGSEELSGWTEETARALVARIGREGGTERRVDVRVPTGVGGAMQMPRPPRIDGGSGRGGGFV